MDLDFKSLGRYDLRLLASENVSHTCDTIRRFGKSV